MPFYPYNSLLLAGAGHYHRNSAFRYNGRMDREYIYLFIPYCISRCRAFCRQIWTNVCIDIITTILEFFLFSTTYTSTLSCQTSQKLCAYLNLNVPMYKSCFMKSLFHIDLFSVASLKEIWLTLLMGLHGMFPAPSDGKRNWSARHTHSRT